MAWPVLLLTRPMPAARRFAGQWRDRFGPDLPVVLSPLTGIVPTGAKVPMDCGLIFTSENAVMLAGPGTGRTAWCVGPRTAQVARRAGFQVVEGPGDAQGLAAQIIAQPPDIALLHARGNERAIDIVQLLRVAGLRADDLVLYHQHDLPMSDQALTLLSNPAPVLAPVFSARGAARLMAALPVPCTAPLLVAAISTAAAQHLPATRMVIATQPDADAMLNALRQLVPDDHAG
ncbi:MAG TPA: uroporphyrinogen-III synthase [Paenirhodobacter sp.]